VLVGLVAATRARWHTTVISLVDSGDCGALLESLGVKVLCCEMRRIGLLRGLARLYGFLGEVQPDVVQTWMYHADLFGGVVARMRGCNAVLWGVRNFTLPAGRVSRSVRAAARLCAVLSRFVPAAIVSCSSQAALAHARRGYVRAKFLVIPNGYDCTQLKPDADARRRLRAHWGIAPDEFLLGMVARWDPLKDHANLMAALARLPPEFGPIRCVLIGAGMTPSNPDLTALARRHGIADRLILAGPHTDVAAAMSALDLHVLSSSSEAFPNVVAEAMACGTPCVVTDVGDARTIIGEHGWAAPPADPGALSRAIREAKTALSGAGRDSLRAACRAHIREHFSHEVMVAAFERAWLSTMRPARGAQA
jgi:glycosyltransferase involved in cell wall biosynthesis